MSQPLLIELSHTSHTRARTGIQRVSRGLLAALRASSSGVSAVPITFDPYAREWRGLRGWEEDNLRNPLPPRRGRGARWPLLARWRGRLRRAVSKPGVRLAGVAPAQGLIFPEIFSPEIAAVLPRLLAAVKGPRVAIFCDAIALRLPELSAAKTVARFPSYLHELAHFDGVAAISEASRDELADYWKWAEIADPPPVVAIPLGIEPPRPFPRVQQNGPEEAGGATILSVGTIEGRKNHLGLLEACEGLWQQGLVFQLRLIGMGQPETGAAALARISALQAAGRPIRFDGPVEDAALEAAYAEAAFTVYPSLAEGFGLPVAESLQRGVPCVCSHRGAQGEIAAGGGCLTVDEPSTAALGEAMATLLQNASLRRSLAQTAAQRRFRTAGDHARELTGWMNGLHRRTAPQ